MTIEAFATMTPEELWDLSAQLANLGPPEAMVQQGQPPAQALATQPQMPGLPPAQALNPPGLQNVPPAPPPEPRPAFPNMTAASLFPESVAPRAHEGLATEGQRAADSKRQADLTTALAQLRTPPAREVVRPPGGSVSVGGGRGVQNLIAQLLAGGRPPGPIRTLGG